MNVVLTGASSGIGYALAKTIAKNGNHVIFALARNKQKLTTLKEECLQINQETKLIPIPFDLSEVETNPEFITNCIEANVQHIDLLINNAGYLSNKHISETSNEKLIRAFKINSIAPILLTKTLLPYLEKAELSHVLNISSMGGFQGSVKFPGLAAYSASKAAIAVFTECFAEEYKEKNIRCNCLALGAVQTEMLEKAFPGFKAPVSAEEMACFISDFAFKQHHYFNGKIIPVSLNTP